MLILNDLWQGEFCPSDSFINDEAEYRKARNVFAELENGYLTLCQKKAQNKLRLL